jgi:hypothetical protein
MFRQVSQKRAASARFFRLCHSGCAQPMFFRNAKAFVVSGIAQYLKQ